jgi:hypothetical protein
LSLHKYTYAHINPINSIDPTGNFAITTVGLLQTIAISNILMTVDISGIGKPTCTCGPDITRALQKLYLRINRHWRSWGKLERAGRCALALSFNGWDIHQLYNESIFVGGSGCGDPYRGMPCYKTATVSGKCYAQRNINYWLWGQIGSLCGYELTDLVAGGIGWRWIKGEFSKEVTSWTASGFLSRFWALSEHEHCRPCKVRYNRRLEFKFGLGTEFIY